MANDGSKYCEDYLLRKEGRSKWMQYWVVIRGVWMLFYRDRATTNRDNFKGSIELSASTKCNIARRGNYSFPFYVSTERGTHLFKCETNLKRHQWMYLIELAVKGDAPAAPPLAIPSSYSRTTPELKPRDLQLNRIETDNLDSESDEDDLSIPPGVILVTTPIEESCNAANPGGRTYTTNGKTSSNQDPVEHNFSRAVLSTGITGTTNVVREPGSPHSSTKLSVKTSAPKVTRPLPSAKGLLPSLQKLPHSGLSLQSTWDRGSPDRPSSSPSPTHTRKYPAQQVASRSSPRSNTRFSRHMARSAPDIQILSLDDPS